MSRIWTGTAAVVSGYTTVVLTGDPLSAANCPLDATLVLGGLVYFVGDVDYPTMTVELTRAYEGSDDASISAEIDPMTAETSSRTALTLQYTNYNARLALLEADGKGLFYTILGQTGANDPGPGKIARNAAAWADVTSLYLDVLDAGGYSAAPLIDEWVTDTVIAVRSIATRAYAAYRLLADPVDESGWRSVAVEYLGGDGILADAEDVAIAWNPLSALTLAYDAHVAEIADLAQFVHLEDGYSVLVSDTGDGTPGIYTLDTSASPADWVGPAVLAGLPGQKGWSPTYSIATDGERRVYQLTGYVGGEGVEPTDNVGDYVGPSGYVSAIGDAADIRGGVGAAGADGYTPGYRLTFSTTTTDSDPGAGVVRFNHETFGSITSIFVDNADAGATSITSWLDGLDDVANANARAYLRFQHATNPAIYAEFAVTGVVTDGTGYRKIPVSPIAGVVPADATVLTVTASKSGADGTDGNTVLNGTVAPTTEGVNGDFYINTATDEIYGPKTGGAWGSATSLFGADGTDPGILLTWDVANGDSDPGTGKIRADNDALGSAAWLYIDKANRAGSDIAAFLLALDDSTTTAKGTLTLTDTATEAQAGWTVTGVTDATGYVKVAVSGHFGATGFADTLPVSLQFSRAGDKGADGAGAVDSVNGQTGVIVLDADDIDDTSTTNKFATSAQLAKVDYLTVTASTDLDTIRTKAGHISVTQAVDLDAIETRVNALDAAVVLMGGWDASAGTFPGGGSAQAGASYIVTVAGTVGGIAFSVNDRVLAITDNASTTTYAANWLKLDYTDQFLSLDGATGAPTLGAIIAAATGKTTPVDGDSLAISDSAASNATKRLTFANLKATLKTYFDSLTTKLTNKRIQARVTTITSSATPTVNTDNTDVVDITALAAAITSMTTNLSGTPDIGDVLIYQIKDNGTARAITWGASFAAAGVALPTTTVISKRLTVGFMWNGTNWGCVGSAQEA